MTSARRPFSRCSVATACFSTGSTTGKSWVIAFGLPGKLMISEPPATPVTARESIDIGVYLQRLGAHRLGQPRHLALDHRERRLRRDVVRREAGATGREDQLDAGRDLPAQPRLDRGGIVGDDVLRDHLGARRSAAASASAGPEMSWLSPAAVEVETVRIAQRIARRAYLTPNARDVRERPANRQVKRLGVLGSDAL